MERRNREGVGCLVVAASSHQLELEEHWVGWVGCHLKVVDESFEALVVHLAPLQSYPASLASLQNIWIKTLAPRMKFDIVMFILAMPRACQEKL